MATDKAGPMSCIHGGHEAFNAPYLGVVLVCPTCRAELAIRTMERPHGLVPLDCGRFGYKCGKCKGSYTTTDAMSCTCPARKRECRRTAKALKEYFAYQRATERPRTSSRERFAS